jgi:hypothetical protein
MEATPPPLPRTQLEQPPIKRGLFKRLMDERHEKKAEQAAAEALYIALLDRLGLEGPQLLNELHAASEAAGLSRREIQRLSDSTFRKYAGQVLADSILTEKEEAELLNVANAVGIDEEELQTTYVDILHELIVARVNDGRLPVVDSPSLMVAGGEVVHLQQAASLMKEVAIREYQGGYSGFSFRVAKGVRFHTGGTRGRSVVVGSELLVADSGILVVSSQRVVFLGSKSTVEIPYKKLLNLDVFIDGVRFHISNRKTAPLFKLASGNVVAAVVNAAFQRI